LTDRDDEDESVDSARDDAENNVAVPEASKVYACDGSFQYLEKADDAEFLLL